MNIQEAKNFLINTVEIAIDIAIIIYTMITKQNSVHYISYPNQNGISSSVLKSFESS